MHPRRRFSVPALPFAVLVALTAIPCHQARAVNLVPNDSFESFTSCPVGFSNMSDCVSWDAPTTGTSDYYNACTSGPNTPDVPNNNFGFQNARTGVAYAGFIPYSAAADYREYVETALTSPLIANVTY